MIDNLNNLFSTITTEIQNGKSLQSLKNIVCEYNGIDWLKFMIFSKDTYTKTVVHKNKYIELVIICWNIKQSSDVHDHPKNGCIIKVLNGELTENIYKIIDDKIILTRKNYLSVGNIGYQEGTTGLHSICNDANIPSVTLHIYSPPNYVVKCHKIN